MFKRPPYVFNERERLCPGCIENGNHTWADKLTARVFFKELLFVLPMPIMHHVMLRLEQQCGFEINKGPFKEQALTETSSEAHGQMVIIIIHRSSAASGSLGSNKYFLPFPPL